MAFIRYIFLLLIVCAASGVFISCNNGNKKLLIEEIEIPETLPHIPDSVSRQKEIDNIAKEMSLYNSVDGIRVAFGNIESEQYKRFTWLKKFASDRELVTLTNHPDPVVKAYSFWALTERNYKDCKVILEQHKNDKSAFSYHVGCLGSTRHINLFYFDRLKEKLNFMESSYFKKELMNSYNNNDWQSIERMNSIF